MKLLITVIVVFLIIVYGYTYIRYKKKRTQSMEHVQEFHEKYKNKKPNINEAASDHQLSANTTLNSDTDTYQPIDFLDRDEFVSDIQSEIREQAGRNNPQVVPKKKLQF